MNRVLPNLALALTSLAIACGASELVLRARFGPPPVWTFPQESYAADAEVGYWLTPGQHAFTHDRPVEINSVGLRDGEYPRVPPPGARRLVALGDSQTFGNGIALEDTWPKQLEQALRRSQPGKRWEVVNAGLAGTATWQQAIVLRRLLDAYDFDGIVVGFYVNDVLPTPGRPQIDASEITNTWTKRAAYILKRSALLNALWEARHPIRAWLSGRTGPSWEEKILTGIPDPLVDAGWRDVERALEGMKRLADERDLALYVVALPRRDQVAGSQPGRAYQHQLEQIGQGLGIRVVDPLPELQASYTEQGDRLFIPWDGHNALPANAAIAQALAREIAQSE